MSAFSSRVAVFYVVGRYTSNDLLYSGRRADRLILLRRVLACRSLMIKSCSALWMAALTSLRTLATARSVVVAGLNIAAFKCQLCGTNGRTDGRTARGVRDARVGARGIGGCASGNREDSGRGGRIRKRRTPQKSENQTGTISLYGKQRRNS